MKKHRAKRLIGALVLVVILGLVWGFVIFPTVVWEDSMEPTLRHWDLCLVRRCRHYEPKRGEIVIFRTADDPPMYFVKRVIALPGETLAIDHGRVSINGAVLAEPYTSRQADWNVAPTNLPPDRIYVIGDNRDLPIDETIHGVVATRLVRGRLVWSWRWH